MTVEEFLGRLERVKRNGAGWVARCPAHDDRNPSLSIGEGDDGRILLTCHAGCTADAVAVALGLELADLFAEPSTGNGRREIVETYPYGDEAGGLLFEVVRFSPKGFAQRRPDGAGGWHWNLRGVRRVLYRLVEIREALEIGGEDTIYIVEGERDVHAIERAGGVATCNPMGAGKWTDELAEQIPPFESVVIVADRDEPGIAHARQVAASIAGRVAFVEIRQAKSGKDAADHLAAGHGLDEFEPLSDIPEPEGASASVERGSRRLASVRADRVSMRSVVWLDRPFLQRSAFHLIAGPKGAGKGTWIAGVVAAMTRGLYGQPRNVLIVATEDSASVDLVPRLVAAGADLGRVHVVVEHFVLPADLHLLEELAREIGDVGLLVIDPIGNHMGGKDTNAEDAVRFAIAGLNKMADDLDCAILGVRHYGKARQQGALAAVLGSTAWVDLPRAVLAFAKDDEDEMVFLVQVVAGNRSGRSIAQAYRLELRSVEGLAEPVTYAVALGESRKDVDDLLASSRRPSKSGDARGLILDILEREGEQESDALDARVAGLAGITAKTAKNVRSGLAIEGLVKNVPVRDEFGAVECWHVIRSHAPRPGESW